VKTSPLDIHLIAIGSFDAVPYRLSW